MFPDVTDLLGKLSWVSVEEHLLEPCSKHSCTLQVMFTEMKIVCCVHSKRTHTTWDIPTRSRTISGPIFIHYKADQKPILSLLYSTVFCSSQPSSVAVLLSFTAAYGAAYYSYMKVKISVLLWIIIWAPQVEWLLILGLYSQNNRRLKVAPNWKKYLMCLMSDTIYWTSQYCTMLHGWNLWPCIKYLFMKSICLYKSVYLPVYLYPSVYP